MKEIYNYIKDSIKNKEEWTKHRRDYSTVFRNDSKRIRIKFLNFDVFVDIDEKLVHLNFLERIKILIKLITLNRYIVSKSRDIRDYDETLKENEVLRFISTGNNVSCETFKDFWYREFGRGKETLRIKVENYIRQNNFNKLQKILKIIEDKRMKVINNKLDPSWTEHFAELEGEIKSAYD